jgi:hypothetical protein
LELDGAGAAKAAVAKIARTVVNFIFVVALVAIHSFLNCKE